jgi:hypothetical protein
VTIRVIGAGLGRTGTTSLKGALEQLLGGPCYHMVEVFGHPEHVPIWHAAMRDEPVDWAALLDGYVAVVDYPGAAVWRAMADAFPDAPVLLSTRRGADEWWRSASATILATRDDVTGMEAWVAMSRAMFERTGVDGSDETGSKAAYERHNAEVRSEVPAGRLIEWQPADGWGPLCEGLGVPLPDEPFPHANTTAEFRAMAGLDP